LKTLLKHRKSHGQRSCFFTNELHWNQVCGNRSKGKTFERDYLLLSNMVSSTSKSGQEIENWIRNSATFSFDVCFVGISLICEFPGYKENKWIEESP
jgi:hypothetical protein